ncbi:sigma 54-interacting transcriptional regulator [Congregibacter variabilis]|uniref:Sigma 54-interacting transcriptional regulator n=1 Tax=Congregibacter variabilis TaxID=3081200 RepID=A0ABZ0I5X9_9GAMM|nr:sigma 54-interacting transcriptional regulator [Congregibacter sp. IMCC43200]
MDGSFWGSAEDRDVQPELCVLIAFHPDTSRIGERYRIACTDDPVIVGRHFPEFAASTTANVKGIGDQYVSREAFSLLREGRDWRIRRNPGRSRLRVNAQELPTEQLFSEEQLQQGLIVSLAQRIVLHLRLQLPMPAQQGAVAALASLKGLSPAMQQLRESTLLAAKSSADVLLIGPTGTGKERIARAIHTLSDRSSGPWVAVNMAATSVEIASASLFGARKGAYTGADSNRSGYFQQADGGTLFLDEVGDTPPTLQPMLLRALQEREIQVVGGKTERVDLRVVAAMEQDPDELRERFRPALRYRLGAQEIRLPALVERREDVALLAADFFGECATDDERPWDIGQSETSIRSWARLFEQLLAYDWPGNIRELQHTVAQISSCSTSELHVPSAVKARLTAVSVTSVMPGEHQPDTRVQEMPPTRLADVSDEDFIVAWRAAKYEVAAIARQLGVSRSAIYRRLESLRECRLAADVPLGEMLAALDACRGDLASTADRLAVSRRGLQTRLRASGVSSGYRSDTSKR